MPTRLDFAAILSMLAAAYPKFTLTKDTSKVYAQLLSDIPVDKLQAAALYCASTDDWFPSVYRLRQAVAELDRRANNVPSAYEAWQDLKKAGKGQWKESVEQDGKFYIYVHEYEFIHPLVKYVAEQLGWPAEFPGDNPVADRAHFFKAYESALAELTNDQIMLPQVREYIEGQRANLLPEGHRDGPKQISDYAKAT